MDNEYKILKLNLRGATAHEGQGLLCPSQYTWPLGAEVYEQMSRSGGQSEASVKVPKPLAAVAEWSGYQIVAGLVTSSSPVPLKTSHHTEQFFTAENPLPITLIPKKGRDYGSPVVRVSDRGWPCHEFEPSTTKDQPRRGAMHVNSVDSTNVLPLVK
ncbi:hypothetical protein TNCV_3413481 [Trichonephila clavipes]|uniref:Uncharacterized protein n=1 Tax=Trichonephila clavipes TaxID=2585209 RepID=A0A8X6REY1_TRICX|nr:hypothetical protein TNCV_3413481 [Trichonephila clavipes]